MCEFAIRIARHGTGQPVRFSRPKMAIAKSQSVLERAKYVASFATGKFVFFQFANAACSPTLELEMAVQY